jgi:hypothetical protein
LAGGRRELVRQLAAIGALKLILGIKKPSSAIGTGAVSYLKVSIVLAGLATPGTAWRGSSRLRAESEILLV